MYLIAIVGCAVTHKKLTVNLRCVLPFSNITEVAFDVKKTVWSTCAHNCASLQGVRMHDMRFKDSVGSQRSGRRASTAVYFRAQRVLFEDRVGSQRSGRRASTAAWGRKWLHRLLQHQRKRCTCMTSSMRESRNRRTPPCQLITLPRNLSSLGRTPASPSYSATCTSRVTCSNLTSWLLATPIFELQPALR